MNNKSGSSFLCIVIIIMIASVYSIKLIKMVSYTIELATQREEQIKQWYATELLFNYAKSWYTQEKETITGISKQYTIPSWPPTEGIFQGIITIKKEKKGVRIIADLLKKGKKVCSLEENYL